MMELNHKENGWRKRRRRRKQDKEGEEERNGKLKQKTEKKIFFNIRNEYVRNVHEDL